MNDNTFELNRFWGIVKETLNNKKITIGVMLLVVALLPLLVLYLSKNFNDYLLGGVYLYTQARFYRYIFAAFTILAPFLFFFNVNRIKKGIVQPMLQASALEKFLNMALFYFVLVPLSVAIVYGVSHNLFATVYPEYLYKFELIDLQHVFLGRLFTPILILLMQTIFFLNLLYREKKARKTIITYLVAVFVYFLFAIFTDILWRGIPFFLIGPLLYVLPVVLFISSYFLLIRKDIQTAPRCDKCGAKLKGKSLIDRLNDGMMAIIKG